MDTSLPASEFAPLPLSAVADAATGKQDFELLAGIPDTFADDRDDMAIKVFRLYAYRRPDQSSAPSAGHGSAPYADRPCLPGARPHLRRRLPPGGRGQPAAEYTPAPNRCRRRHSLTGDLLRRQPPTTSTSTPRAGHTSPLTCDFKLAEAQCTALCPGRKAPGHRAGAHCASPCGPDPD